MTAEIHDEPPSLAELALRASLPSTPPFDPVRFEGGGYREAPMRVPTLPQVESLHVSPFLGHEWTIAEKRASQRELSHVVSALAVAFLLVVVTLAVFEVHHQPHLDRGRCVEVRR